MNPYQYMRHLAVGPFTLAMYLLFAWGFLVYNSLEEGIRKKLWYFGYGVPFAILDILYNITIGSFIFWELPKELMFTCRITRLKDEGNTLAATFCKMLEIYDEGHCQC